MDNSVKVGIGGLAAAIFVDIIIIVFAIFLNVPVLAGVAGLGILMKLVTIGIVAIS